MNINFHRLMADAARLVRGGNLQAATDSIQAALNGRDAAAPPGREPAAATQDTVIDVEAREVGAPALPQRPVQETPQAAGPSPSAPVGKGRFISADFGTGRAGRGYKLYVPPQAGERPLPLVVMLHGCKQDPDDFARGTQMNDAARALGCFVLYPAQSAQANPQRCWNWFKHTHQQRGRGEPALLAAMTQHVMATHPIDASRVYVAGLSAGGAMAAILAEAYPELYAAVGVHSGLASGSAGDLPSALSAMRSGRAASPTQGSKVPTIVFHGDADKTVHPSNGEHVIAASLQGHDAADDAQRERAAGGRNFTRRVHRSPSGEVVAEHWVVHGSGHGWSGGSHDGSYTDPAGPDASAEMLRFFLEHPRR